MNGAPDPGLRAAFLGATYGTREERFRLDGQPGPAPSWARGPWAVVTAWNPGGRRAGDRDNARAGAELLGLVRAAGFVPLPSVNGEGDWQEEALIIPGVRLCQTADWGTEFGQAAVLWATGARVALVWLRGGRVVGVERRWARAEGANEQDL